MQPHIATQLIDHVSLMSFQAERAARFYTDLLGLHSTDHPPEAAGSGHRRISIGNGQRTLIAIDETPNGPAGQAGTGSIHHVALAIDSFDMLLKWKRWLQSNDLLVYGPYDQQAYQTIIFMDPDGVLLELATRGPGWSVTENGQEVYSPPKTSMAPFRDEEGISHQTWSQPVTNIGADMTLREFHHISTIVSSLEDTDRFYRDALGLQLLRKALDHDDPEVQHWYWGRDGGQLGTVITAFPVVHSGQAMESTRGHAGVGVVDHFALGVDMDTTALRRWHPDGSSQERESSPAPNDRPSWVSVRGPDGQVVELIAADARAQGRPHSL